MVDYITLVAEQRAATFGLLGISTIKVVNFPYLPVNDDLFGNLQNYNLFMLKIGCFDILEGLVITCFMTKISI